jgi:hypothetical protein
MVFYKKEGISEQDKQMNRLIEELEMKLDELPKEEREQIINQIILKILDKLMDIEDYETVFKIMELYNNEHS